MGSLRNDRRYRRLSLVAGISLALAAGAALSDAPKKNEAQPGLLSYPNVKVINAPELAEKAATVGGQAGIRAYVDEAGRARQETNEDRQKNAAADKAKLSAPAVRSRTRAATVNDASSDGSITLEDGSVLLLMGEETQVFQVVRKTESGLATGEFQGAAAAKKAVSSEVKEVRHDR